MLVGSTVGVLVGDVVGALVGILVGGVEGVLVGDVDARSCQGSAVGCKGSESLSVGVLGFMAILSRVQALTSSCRACFSRCS